MVVSINVITSYSIHYTKLYDYPLLLPKIKKHLPDNIKVVEQGEIVALSLQHYLTRHPEMDDKCTKNGSVRFFTTESVEKFKQTAEVFFKGALHVEHLVL